MPTKQLYTFQLFSRAFKSGQYFAFYYIRSIIAIDNQLFIIFEMMNYVISPIFPPYCCLVLPTALPGLALDLACPAALEPADQGNAEIIQEERVRVPVEQKITVTRQDLLQQGYKQAKKAWEEDQDNILLGLCRDENIRFEEVAQKMVGRNAKMCYSRYRRLVNQSKESWTKAEDERLRQLVQEFGCGNWKSLASQFPNRNFKQLKEHYENYLRPDLTTREWTLQEDLQLIALFNRYGKDWGIIQKSMFWRSRNQLKNRLCGRILRLDAKKKQASTLTNQLIKQKVFIY